MPAVPKYRPGELTRHDVRRTKSLTRRSTWRALVREVAERDGPKCRVCGRYCKIGSHRPEHYADPHHIILRSAGGPDTLANIVTVCRRCHDDRHCHGVLAMTGDANQKDREGRFNGLLVSRRINGSWYAIGAR